VAPGQCSGALRIASFILHILSQTEAAPESSATQAFVIGRKAAQERFSEEVSGSQFLHAGNVFLKLKRQFTLTRTDTFTASLD
jgi:hypothetical protein